MPSLKKQFLADSEHVAFDLKHRKTIEFNIGKYDSAFRAATQRYSSFDEAKIFASSRKSEALAHLADNLELFEQKITRRGAQVLWAENAQQAIEQVIRLVEQYQLKSVVKSKSMTTEEIHFNTEMDRVGVESVETDLGEFIVQLANEPPYHIVTPAMHKSRADVAALFHQELHTPPDTTAEELTEHVRLLLRKKYTTADFGVTGANFLVADVGAVAVTENEGNALMSTAFPKIHLVIAGIEKMIPSYKDIGHFWPLLSAHGTGQKLTAYSSLFFGPRQPDETDGPEQMFVILLDNKRSDIYTKPVYQEALKCIRCGACLNACPIYHNVGGYTYNTTYSGPIGSVLTAHFKGFEYSHLAFACTLCGKCTEVCPVKIPLHDLLLENRREAVEVKLKPKVENTLFASFLMVLRSRFWIDVLPVRFKNAFMQLFAAPLWGKHRLLPKMYKSFAATYKKK